MTSRAWLGGMARRALAAPLKGRARRFPPAGALDEMKNWPHKPRAAHQLRPFYLLAALAFCTQARVL
ncbi:MAG TPA: hypothetical protein VL326_11305, partial [Kofleriaceae bacterium]|nr:hypothetical protein [Kofleriaceae bacterium]